MLIVGLGNPGDRYRSTRHNAGFMVLDELARRWGIAMRSKRWVELGQGSFRGDPVILAKPLTFMNISGEAVKRLRRKHHLAPADILVLYDDIDLARGSIRLRAGGSAGGHRGLDSIIGHLGSNEFPRLKLGVGRPPAGREAADYVLERMRPEEAAELQEQVARAADAVETFLAEGAETAMNRFNRGS